MKGEKMIVERYTFHVKSGKVQDAIEWANEGRKNVWSQVPTKIYSSMIGPWNTIVIENEFEDFADREKSQNQVGTSGAWADWIAKWDELIDGHGKNEIWNVE
jgi:hypothetical protein